MHQVHQWVRTATSGPANRVTLLRAVLTGVVAVLAAVSLLAVEPDWVRTAIVWIAAPALALDLVDGWLARRTGTVSDFGARFDMETDAVLILVLSTLLVGPVGWWVLLIGLARHLLLAAEWLWPWLAEVPADSRRWRKVVAAVQGVVLLVGVADVTSHRVAVALLVVALALLAVSFGTEAVERVRRTSSRSRGAGRRSAALTLLAAAVVWACLDLPAAKAEVTPLALARVPVEALALVGLVVLLPRRAGRLLAGLAGWLAVALVLLRAIDLGFDLLLHRSFSPLFDWNYLASGVGVLTDSVGPLRAGVSVVGVVLLVVLLAVVLPLAAVRLARAAGAHRAGAGVLVVSLLVAATSLGAAGLQPARGLHFASTTTSEQVAAQVDDIRQELRDRPVFAREITTDPWAASRPSELLRGLRGHDVLLVFVESYGRVAVEGTTFSPGIDRVLDRGTRRLAAAGFGSRSAFLTSPTFGAGSWLAHASVQSGLWVESQRRYDQLLARDRLTLTGAFGAAGWRTLLVVPADTQDWPAGERFYGPDALLDSRNLGYEGPQFGYAPVPDQYTLSWLARNELRPGSRPPVMAEVDLVSSHHPWVPLPRMVGWDEVGDGSVYDSMPTSHDEAVGALGDPDRVRAAYGLSVEYSLKALLGFVERMRHRDPGLVVLMMGDHQPHSYVTGEDPGRDVPVSLIAPDHVLRRIDGWGWQPGLRPSHDAPVWRMDTVRDRIFEAFG